MESQQKDTSVNYRRSCRKVLIHSKVSRGHDATTLLAWIIPIATKRKRKDGAIVSAQLVESYLRTAYPLEAFVKCELYGHIAHGRVNVPYRVLKK